MTQPPIPVRGRFGVIGYDKNLALQGDYASIAGVPASAMNNGFLFFYPSRNVELDLDSGIWDVDLGIWDGTQFVYVREFIPVGSGVYYPDVDPLDPDPHDWIISDHNVGEMCNTGYMVVFGYDGTLAIPGDLQPGIDNGILFTRPITNPHVVYGPGGSVWHGLLNINDGTGYVNVWAAYPSDHCMIQVVS